MADQKVKMTQADYLKLQAELEERITKRRQEIIERIAEARSHGDLSENAEYDAAREEQRNNEGKIEELTLTIKNAEIVEENHDTSYVHLGSIVTVYDEDMEEKDEYTIVSVTAVDTLNNKISGESPMGKALLNRKLGERVEVKAPQGSYFVKILKIEA